MDNNKQLRDKHAALSATARSIVAKALAEGRALRPSEEVDIEGIELKASAIARTLRVYSRLDSTQDLPGEQRGSFVECVRALHNCHGNLPAAVRYLEVQSPALARALSASVGAAGGFAIPEGFQSEAIEALRPLVSVRKLRPTILPAPHGNITWPRISAPSTANYVGENVDLPVTQATFAALLLTAKKQVGFVPVSNTFLRSTSPAGDVIIKNDLIASVAATEDYNFLRGDGTEFTPRGLRNWALPANVIASNVTLSLANTDADLASLELALANANVRMLRPGWIFSPRTETYLRNLRGTGGNKAYPEMEDGMLRGKPFASTTNVPVNLGGSSNASEIYLADFADVVIAEYPLVIDVAAAAIYTDPATNQKVNAFQADQSVIRVISQADLGMRHAESVAVLTGVTWGA